MLRKEMLAVDKMMAKPHVICTQVCLLLVIFIQSLRVDCLRLAYDDTSPPKSEEHGAPPLILIHGLMTWRKDWKHIAPELARNTGRKVYAIDLRNHGDSPWSDDMSLDDIVSDMEQFFKKKKIEKAALLGYSFGGKVAMYFTLKKPEKVEKLIVEEMKVQDMSRAEMDVLRLTFSLYGEALEQVPDDADKEEAIEAISQYLMPFSQLVVNPGNLEPSMAPLKFEDDSFHWKANIDVLNKAVTLIKMKQDHLGSFDGETLIIYGSESPFNIKEDEKAEKVFPRVVKVPIEGGHHVLHFEFQEEFIDKVSQFLMGEYKP